MQNSQCIWAQLGRLEGEAFCVELGRYILPLWCCCAERKVRFDIPNRLCRGKSVELGVMMKTMMMTSTIPDHVVIEKGVQRVQVEGCRVCVGVVSLYRCVVSAATQRFCGVGLIRVCGEGCLRVP